MNLIDGDVFWQRLKFYCEDCNSYEGVRCRACDIGTALELVEEQSEVDAIEKIAEALSHWILCSHCPVDGCYGTGKKCRGGLTLWLKGVVKNDDR